MRISPPLFSVEQHEFVSDFVARSGNRFVYGRTAEARSIADHIEIDGYIDDFTKDLSYRGKPCIRLCDVPAGSRVVSTVVQAFANVAIANLKSAAVSFVDYFAFRALSNLPIVGIPYWDGARDHFDSYRVVYQLLFDALADEESKDVFERILNFRLNYDLREMSSFTANLSNMYFEPFLEIPDVGAVFFDVGSFDGYNSEQFERLYPRMKGSYLFEPIPFQIQVIQSKHKHDKRYHLFELAVSDFDGECTFNVMSTASHLSTTGEGIRVQATRLDSFCPRIGQVPDFIKMDIEGAEISALRGAVNTIKQRRPNLAISVYHRASHLIDAFNIIRKANPSYRFFLRHYTEGYTETVLFAI